MKRDEPPGSGPLSSSPATNDSREVGGVSYVLSWLDQALRLEDELVLVLSLRDELAEENRQLRKLIVDALFAVQQCRARERRELLNWATREIETRGPRGEAR